MLETLESLMLDHINITLNIILQPTLMSGFYIVYVKSIYFN